MHRLPRRLFGRNLIAPFANFIRQLDLTTQVTTNIGLLLSTCLISTNAGFSEDIEAKLASDDEGDKQNVLYYYSE
jgi:hypothetical protein